MAYTPNGLRMAPPKTKADALTSGSVMASIAQMDESERSKLMAELKGEMEPDPEDEEDGTEGDTDKCKDKKADPACAASASDDFKAGYAAANDRFAAVYASEHFAGREAKACAFLKTSMSAEEIVGLLAHEPKASADDGGAAAIVNAITGANANVDAGGGGDLAPKAASPWKGAVASINKRNGF